MSSIAIMMFTNFGNSSISSLTAKTSVSKELPTTCHSFRFQLFFPALNVHRHKEPEQTYTIYADSLAVDNRSTCAYVFVGIKSLITDVYGMKTDDESINIVEDDIRC